MFFFKHYSSRNGNKRISELLLQHGASVNSQTTAGQSTPLHRAALKGCGQIVALLLQYDADPCAQDADGKTPLHKVRNGLKCKSLFFIFFLICLSDFGKNGEGGLFRSGILNFFISWILA